MYVAFANLFIWQLIKGTLFRTSSCSQALADDAEVDASSQGLTQAINLLRQEVAASQENHG